MRRICAWCKKSINEDGSGQDSHATHGICPDCLAFFEKNVPRSLEQFLDEIKAPVLLVDFDINVLAMNRTGLSLLKKKPDQVKGAFPGDVMECKWARLPGGCGRQTHCLGCSIRRSVGKVFETGEKILRAETWLDRQTPDGQDQRVRLFLSAAKKGELVFLRIDGLERG